MENQQDLDKQDEELRMLYQVTIDDIKWAKVHQYRIVYYVLLIFAAVIIFCTKIGGECGNIPIEQKLFLLVPAWFINGLGLYHIMDTQKSLCIYRMRILGIRSLFTIQAQGILDIRDKDKKDYTKFTKYYFTSYTLVFAMVIIIGVSWVIWFLFKGDDRLIRILLLVIVVDVEFLVGFYLRNDCILKKYEEKFKRENMQTENNQ